MARHAGQPIGCLLLDDQAELDQLELLYLGLDPAVRGRGWGLELVRHAQWYAARIGRGRVVLAVDAANEPANRVYASAGFRVWEQHRMFAKAFPPASRVGQPPNRTRKPQ